MSTNVSDIYDALVTRAAAIYTAHTRLTNPYDLTDNNWSALTLGWGLAWGQGINSNRLMGDINSIRREFKLILARKFYAREFDVTSKATVEKLLFEDQKLLITDIKNQNQLTVATGRNHVNFIGDEGITSVPFQDKNQFLILTSNIEVEYFET